MRKYTKYKPVKNKVINEIPVDWESYKIKWILSSIESGGRETGGGNQLENGIFSIGGEHISWYGTLDLSNPKYISEIYYSNMNKGKVKLHDVLLVKDGATIGKCAIVNVLPFEKIAVNEHVYILRANKKSNNPFLFYFIQSNQGQEQIKQEIRGSAQGGLSNNIKNEIIISIPPPKEQHSIVRFLDYKTRQIDRFIVNRHKQIELLMEQKASIINKAVTQGITPDTKFKPSGIEWIGEIPENWEVWRLKFLAKKISKGTTPSTEGREFLDKGVIRFLKAENITPDGITYNPEFFIDEETNKILKRSQLQHNDILFVIAGATIGKAAIITKEFLPANTNQAVCFIRLKTRILPELVYHQLQSNYVKNKMTVESVVAAQPNISMEDIGNFQMFLPPMKEQEKLFRYIQEEASVIDTLISKYQKQIDLMQEYRTSLINQAVTGKIDVREWQPKAKKYRTEQLPISIAAEK